ncbi:DsrE/DsrF/DrsH-like family protein [Virgibacillus sp. W0430]|uniref:DsrE/DsrF/DrsH-like family protein n=1 Tax=Virgibacillus sp. W0430 TaxID=3391580 RepID=UPI003F455B52
MEQEKGTTIVVFSGELDKVMAAFIIANGAAAYGHKVTMFFTFWGLNTLKDEAASPGKKGPLEKMFGWMMPKGANKLGLSKMHYLGIGPKLIKHVIKKHKAMTVPQLIELAQEQDIKLVACTMTMDLLGIKQEEMMDGIEYGGVAAYIGDAENANTNLFI